MSEHSEDRSKRAFEDLYDRTGRRSLGYLVRRMGDVDAATELWAECWATAFISWPKCKGRTAGEVDAWLFGIARNQLGSYYRRGCIAGRAREQLDWVTPKMAETELTQIADEEDLESVREALRLGLAQLTPLRRQAVELRIVEGLSYATVSVRLACSEQAARAHVSRGLKQLHRYLSREQLLDV